MSSKLSGQVRAAANVIRNTCRIRPQVAIILGTGLGGLAREICQATVIDYEDIPDFPQSAVESHEGMLVLGALAGKKVAALSGRFHYYEGWTMQQLTLPVRVMRALGAKVLIVSAACGGMNPQHRLGDLVFIEDHINLMGDNPLIGPNDEALGPRFPDMSRPYDPRLIAIAEQAALSMSVRAHTGVYAGVSGPNLETRAEYRFLRMIGADVVGMSTVPEVIVAVHAGMRVFGAAVITDMCFPDALEPADIGKIIAVAREAEPKLTAIVKQVIARL
jgi:purine-nucleoside phosphorylase